MATKTREWLNSLQQVIFTEREVDEKKGFIVVPEKTKYNLMLLMGTSMVGTAFLFNQPLEIITGLQSILVSPSILVSDYMAIGNIGAALFNGGLLMILSILIARRTQVNMNGPLMASIILIGGFALFGKNLYNVWAIMLGVLLYAKYKKENFGKYILIAYFGTTLGPLVSQVTFGFGWPLYLSVPAGYATGIVAGFFLTPLATHFISFHQGYNLYNIGFTAGIIGMFFMSFMRGFGLNNPATLVVAEGFNRSLGNFLFLLFTAMLIVGLYYSRRVLPGLFRIFRQSGRLVSDFVTTDGFGAAVINMALLGYAATYYVLFVGGELNGPIIGGIFTVVGFGAFGKHLKNALPVLAGVYIATLFKIWDPNSTGALLAALFGTTLAPISGAYGWKYGVLAGILHMSVVMNVGYLHGGMNLYNNGFSGGFVAAVLVLAIDTFKKAK